MMVCGEYEPRENARHLILVSPAATILRVVGIATADDGRVWCSFAPA
ncbi:hypothetical protein Plim_2938 [Planctopirus limnophila DSM 3776]|uniref:Uncharacterized protein n=1 Tax=Planctopirus limnophila (strain ATCC 43296 / DSM 3776 / IFAM 1008 / Mu 290) TaxID=521674 RepID=D5SS36_PLAL2|nr:hypothetical protein Plim_2938 [Planctopirus limnophila DSM 3776]